MIYNNLKSIRLASLLMLILLILAACEKNVPSEINKKPIYGSSGFFFVNEGNFTWGNGSLSFFSYDSLNVKDKVFEEISGKALGDIPLRVISEDDRLYIIVNNSGRIEVVDPEGEVYLGSIDGLISPRDLEPIGNDHALVSSLYSDSLVLINTSTLSISSYINIGCSSECILAYGDYIFVSNWSGGNKIVVLNAHTFEIVKSIAVVKEPSTMIIDKSGNLRVLCTSGYMSDEFPALISIDTDLLEVSATILFKTKNIYPSELVINSTLDTLFFLNTDIYRMAYTDLEIPDKPFIESNQRNLYRLGFDTNRNVLITTDAVDYVQKGYIYGYTGEGTELFSTRAGIIPGKICN